MSVDNLNLIFTPEQTKQRAELQKAEQEKILKGETETERLARYSRELAH
jgi:hypothetical protein